MDWRGAALRIRHRRIHRRVSPVKDHRQKQRCSVVPTAARSVGLGSRRSGSRKGFLESWRSQRLRKLVGAHAVSERNKLTVGTIVDCYYDNVLGYCKRAAIIELEAACTELQIAL